MNLTKIFTIALLVISINTYAGFGDFLGGMGDIAKSVAGGANSSDTPPLDKEDLIADVLLKIGDAEKITEKYQNSKKAFKDALSEQALISEVLRKYMVFYNNKTKEINSLLSASADKIKDRKDTGESLSEKLLNFIDKKINLGVVIKKTRVEIKLLSLEEIRELLSKNANIPELNAGIEQFSSELLSMFKVQDLEFKDSIIKIHKEIKNKAVPKMIGTMYGKIDVIKNHSDKTSKSFSKAEKVFDSAVKTASIESVKHLAIISLQYNRIKEIGTNGGLFGALQNASKIKQIIESIGKITTTLTSIKQESGLFKSSDEKLNLIIENNTKNFTKVFNDLNSYTKKTLKFVDVDGKSLAKNDKNYKYNFATSQKYFKAEVKKARSENKLKSNGRGPFG
jgi:hypothetical protein